MTIQGTYQNPLTGIEKVIEGFKKPQLTKAYPNVHEIKLLKDQILWALWVIDEKFPTVGYIPPEWISEILIEGLKISTTPTKVKKALATVKGNAHPKKIEGQNFYKIMQSGIDYLQNLNREDTLFVHRIGGTKPRTDKKFLASIIKESKSEIKIVDPFYGSKTLDNLEKIHFGKPIKLLTARLGYRERPSDFQNDWNDFKTEYNNVEIKTYNNPNELHDRYILTKNSIIFLGHGIKDFGGKESFVIVFQGKTGKNILSDLTKQFDSRWNNSRPI